MPCCDGEGLKGASREVLLSVCLIISSIVFEVIMQGKIEIRYSFPIMESLAIPVVLRPYS